MKFYLLLLIWSMGIKYIVMMEVLYMYTTNENNAAFRMGTTAWSMLVWTGICILIYKIIK